ncbi:hypothetical protein E2C01_048992 [Portunus trituberculatus]|uniref:Uncharacterized protein n=1 Tax=Portunus trituberculatus TaxID=210409 RepID=A0A5B7G4H2_PORTR|nr:hypothetical protein [Portunus trituberculatus]
MTLVAKSVIHIDRLLQSMVFVPTRHTVLYITPPIHQFSLHYQYRLPYSTLLQSPSFLPYLLCSVPSRWFPLSLSAPSLSAKVSLALQAPQGLKPTRPCAP